MRTVEKKTTIRLIVPLEFLGWQQLAVTHNLVATSTLKTIATNAFCAHLISVCLRQFNHVKAFQRLCLQRWKQHSHSLARKTIDEEKSLFNLTCYSWADHFTG